MFVLILFRGLFLFGAIYSAPLYAFESISLLSSNSRCNMTQRIEAALFQNPDFRFNVQRYLVSKTAPATYRTMENENGLIVAIGSEALEAALKNQVEVPILSVLIRENYFKKLLNRYNRTLTDPKKPIYVIYLDQPLSRQFNLLKTLFGEESIPHMGVVLSHDAYSQQSIIQSLAKEKNIIAHIGFVNGFDQPINTLNRLFEHVDFILAIPDSKIYHAGSVRGILLSAFHHRMPIIGYSRTFVNNGALACVYSNGKQISEQTARTVLGLMQPQNTAIKLSNEQYPDDFSIAINYQVAKSLGFSLSDQESIKLEVQLK